MFEWIHLRGSKGEGLVMKRWCFGGQDEQDGVLATWGAWLHTASLASQALTRSNPSTVPALACCDPQHIDSGQARCRMLQILLVSRLVLGLQPPICTFVSTCLIFFVLSLSLELFNIHLHDLDSSVT